MKALFFTRMFTLMVSCLMYLSIVKEDDWVGYVFIAAGAAMYAANHVLLTKETNAIWFCLIDIAIGFSFGFIFPGTGLFIIMLCPVAVAFFLRGFPKRTAWSVLCLSSILFLTVLIRTYAMFGNEFVIDHLTSMTFVVFCGVVGKLIRKLLDAQDTAKQQFQELTESHLALSAAHQELHLYAKQVEELTAIYERNRMAREIHDTVGHKMTALLVQLQLLREWQKRDSQKADETVGVCETLAREALDDVRLSVRTLQTENDPSLIESLKQLTEDFCKNAGVTTEFAVSGDPAIIPLSLHPTLIRTAQEALTNAKRHGGATACSIQLACTTDSISLVIKDDGKGNPEAALGFGLLNMKKRAAEHGGTIRFESERDQGFTVIAEFSLANKKWSFGPAQQKENLS
ncbi:two-component system sensor histidine kinase LnrJ [Bacillus subtilis]|nr:two-component system sensor histidine kinase LnrJ [Bacillus subtilis]MDH3119913.1 two-component system sensor histidine kinase LnrJ [Bacillus subtilis]MDX6158320.1 two-component system sensor histidine kinase LnrJ [Bacillus subtilis]MEC1006050.1 two-component system sensor histidine kinase LnrJ [Bacillus subtilis]MEC1074727.1 two-component system sensor histidine kinase LnrJ [Bacillus subtilis]UYP04215.1 two-component system sensor histidine kinase LnrJ [Bacillus subtilis]